MRNLLVELEDTNNKCRVQLAKLLAQRHHVRMAAGKANYPADCGQALVAFGAFDPWHTCLRQSTGASRFFEAAERKGVITSTDADLLSRLLLDRLQKTASIYSGRYHHYFEHPTVKTILRYAPEPEHLAGAGLAIGSIVDHLFEACPWTIAPDVHLNATLFGATKLPDDISALKRTVWDSWANTLDFVHLGPWSGLPTSEILTIVEALDFGETTDYTRLSTYEALSNLCVGFSKALRRKHFLVL